MFEQMLSSPDFWSNTGQFNDTVFSTRLRYSRNHANYKFPEMMSIKEKIKLKEIAKDFAFQSQFSKNINFYELDNISDIDRRFLRERSCITSKVEKNEYSAIIQENNNLFSILINENDHFKIQVLRSGLELDNSFKLINNIDDELNNFIPFAFSHKYGFLTSSLNNIGTAFKISLLLHLPATNLLNKINILYEIIDNDFIDLKPVSEQSDNYSAMYIISNKVSLGKTEDEIIILIKQNLDKIINKECQFRDNCIANKNSVIIDKIWRSYGLLLYSRIIAYSEAIEYLSNVRLGIIMAVIKGIDISLINDLLVKVQIAHLQKIAQINDEEITDYDQYRANFLRNSLNKE